VADRILAFDLGTGGSKAALYDPDGLSIASTFVPYETSYPDTGWHEQRPSDWWRAIVDSTRQLLAMCPSEAGAIRCLAVSGHSLGVVPLDKDGCVLREFTPIWSDTRAGRQTAAFFRQVDRTVWYMTTGNGFPPECYPVFKIMWYRDQEPAMFARLRHVIGTKDYVNFRLTGRIATDYSYASGSGAYDLRSWDYRPEFLEAAGVPAELLPEITSSTGIIGSLQPEAARELGLPGDVQVACGGVDNSCMALGARNIKEGRIYTSLGSSSWIAVSSRQPVLDARMKPFVFAHVVPELFTSAVSIFAAGSSLRWIRDVIFAGGGAVGDRDPYEAMNEMAARSPAGANRLIFNPSLAGGTSQEASPHIRGCFSGLDLRHTRDDLVRAGMEGIAMNLGAVLDVLRRFVPLSGEMLLVGGGAKSRLWRQIFADVYAMDVVKTRVDQDAGVLGAAALAAVGVGWWKNFDRIDEIHRIENVERPIPENAAVYRSLKPVFERVRECQAEIGDMLRML
jgi:xylulokinase